MQLLNICSCQDCCLFIFLYVVCSYCCLHLLLLKFQKRLHVAQLIQNGQQVFLNKQKIPPKRKVNIAKQAFVDPFVFRLLAYQNNCVIFQVFINRQNPVFSLPLDLHFFIFLQNSVDQRHLKILKINYFINIMCPNVELKGKEVEHNILCVHVIVYVIVLHHLSFSSGRRIKLKLRLLLPPNVHAVNSHIFC